MNAEPKRAAIVSNIKLIQRRIEQLETSYQNLQVEVLDREDDDDLMPETIEVYEQNNHRYKSPPNRKVPASDSQFNSTKKRSTTSSQAKTPLRTHQRRSDQENNDAQDLQPNESLLRQIDLLEESERQYQLKLETMTFRCEKLQTELVVKLDQVNRLTLELEEKTAASDNITTQMRFLEQQVEQHKKSVAPEHLRLKSQYDVSLMELKALEHDNSIIESRVRDLSQTNANLRNENRELKQQNNRIEMERLSLKKEIESLRGKFMDHQSDYEDLSDNYEVIKVENDRLRNELSTMTQKASTLTIEMNSNRHLLGRLDLEKKPDRIKAASFHEVIATSAKISEESALFLKTTKRSNNENFYPYNPKSLSNSYQKNINESSQKYVSDSYQKSERLDFDGLIGIEERFKKLNK